MRANNYEETLARARANADRTGKVWAVQQWAGRWYCEAFYAGCRGQRVLPAERDEDRRFGQPHYGHDDNNLED